MSELVLISVTGTDRPSITAAITQILSQQNVDVLDIGQSVIHNQLSLGVLVNIPGDRASLKTAINRRFSDFMVQVNFTAVTDRSYDAWVGRQGSFR